jgi:hypothetical protein
MKRKQSPSLQRGAYVKLALIAFSGLAVIIKLGALKSAARRKRSAVATLGMTAVFIYFGVGKYNPSLSDGKRLLAHELTQVRQETGGVQHKLTVDQPEKKYNQEAQRVAEQAISMDAPEPSIATVARELQPKCAGSQEKTSSWMCKDNSDAKRRNEVPLLVSESFQSGGAIKDKKSPNSLDAKALAIINAAQDKSKPLSQRAVQAVRSIINQYYSSQASNVSDVRYLAKTPGLETQSVGSGPTTKGIITVGDYFINNTTTKGFARRVLQVGHELQHIDQYRTGMGGEARRHEREFLAFYWEATTEEKPGTGRMSHATRVSLIDAALMNLNCLKLTGNNSYAINENYLLNLRKTEQAASGQPETPVPTLCGG